MGRLAVVIIMLMVLSVLQGCIRISTRVSVNPDGSGTVTERVVMNLSYLKSMLGSEKAEKQGGSANVPSREDLEKIASVMGDEVRLKGVRNYTDGFFEGYEAVYSFKDVAGISISGRPDKQSGVDSLRAVSVSGSDRKDRIGFRFFRGSPAKLVIVMPKQNSLLEPEKNDSQANPPTNPDQQKLSLAIIREAFSGTRMRLAVAVTGEIVSTDAACMDSAEVILADVDFDRLLMEEDPDAALLRFMGYGSDTEAISDMLNRVPGVRGEIKKEVTVLFQ
ncbi:MAG: hypothetical protein JW989_05455 [Chlorobiaceae bacterium]|nr:hypothetical protein [Chlorobiaceae bacterium]